MKATELRIGNLVHPHGDNSKVDKVKTLGFTEFVDCEPIQLTDEWIYYKFGFIVKGETCYGTKYVYPMSDWGFTIENSYKDNTWFFGHEFYDAVEESLNNVSINIFFDLKYVHQLQNIFHSLTGEELEIKP